ncbi:MAG: S8 family serine peptidase [Anaerolineae bacterium]|nr:MAG: S8 family serine peptidase [Anaerolineae bacterium]
MRLGRCRTLCNLLLILTLLAFPASPLAGAVRPAPGGEEVALLVVLPPWFSPSAVSGFPPPLPPEVRHKIEPSLLKQLLLDKDARLRFIVHLAEQADLSAVPGEASALARRQRVVFALQVTAERTQAGVRAFLARELAAGRVADVRPFWIFNGLALTGGWETAFALAARPEVAILRADHERHLPDELCNREPVAGRLGQPSGVEWNVERIRAPLVWQALGIDGAGVVVANVDSGVDWLHPALQPRYRGYDPHGMAHRHVGNWFDATGVGATYPVDSNGHGSHTMGIIVGDEGIGVAPGAQWIAVRAFNSAGVGYESWIHAAFEWLLAPAGDPALAPDVVNNSWGNIISSSEVFRDDVRALRQAGILAVFSAGNSGPRTGTVGSPASYPEALAVGATDQDDEIASFSSRGPSPWSEVKPEVSAPGVDVRSALPGGSYGSRQGTSMAVPHVAGVLALMLQADASLAVTDAEQALITAAVPLPAEGPVPNNDYGWGRVDAYAAVMAVAARGLLSGLVAGAGDGAPLPRAAVAATPTEGGPTVQTAVDERGRYALGLRPGQWNVTASAFGYRFQTVNRVSLVTGTTTVQDFALTALPAGLLSGTVVEAGSGAPLSATVTVEGVPVWGATDPANGAYSLTLPAGAYTVSVRSVGHRFGRAAAVPIAAGQTTVRHFQLITAPTILLVDSGAWYYGSQLDYYEAALDELSYLYDVHAVKHLPDDVPAATDLTPYDLVIWSAPQDAPGYIGASTAITSYLESGGRLVLSGQDVGFWDGGGSGLAHARYFWDYLYARFLADDAPTRQVAGRSDDLFAGLGFSIEGGDGANNQAYPDVIAVGDPHYAAPVLDYRGDGSAGQRVGLCRPYRVLYLAFGLEGVDSAGARREVMQRSISWLMSPRQQGGAEWALRMLPVQIALPGETVMHLLHLRNTGETLPADTYEVTLESARGWEHSLSAHNLTLSSCLTTALTLTVQIPAAAGWDEAERMTVTARSLGQPAVTASSVVTSKTPAPILLVDDDRWYDQQGRYTATLGRWGYRHDIWDVEARGWVGPPAETLRLYPIVVWFTAYDWFSPLTDDEEARLMGYLDAGGRLFFSGQDYLYMSVLPALRQDYFGLVDHTDDLTSTAAIGVRGNPVGDHLGPFALDYPYLNWSDALNPALEREAAFAGQHGQVIGVSHAGENFKTVFFGFPFETMDEGARAAVMERVIGWLNWLGGSSFEVDRPLAPAGQTLAFTLTLRNDGLDDVAQAVVTNTLPASLTLVPGSLSPPEAGYGGGTVRWQGGLARGEAVAIAYRAQPPGALPAGALILNAAQVELVEHGLTFTRTARTRVDAPDLSNSQHVADRDAARPGETLTYELVVRNDGLADAPTAWLTNPVPHNTTYLTDSLALQGGGEAVQANGVITWAGALSRGQPVTLTYQAVISSYAGYEIVGRTWLADGYGEVWDKVAHTSVPPFTYHFPLIFKDD